MNDTVAAATHSFELEFPVFHPPLHLYAGSFLDHSINSNANPPLVNSTGNRQPWSNAHHISKLTHEGINPSWIQLNCGQKLLFSTLVGLSADHFLSGEDLYMASFEDLDANAWTAVNAYDFNFLLDKTRDNGPRRVAVQNYFRGLLTNYDHFNGDGSAQKRFLKEFQISLDLAKESYKTEAVQAAQKLYHHALAQAAFACHFLSDCFSSGHIRTPRRATYQACKLVYGSDVPVFLHTLSNMWFGNAVFEAESAEMVAGAYSGVAHNCDGQNGVKVKIDDGMGYVKEYLARGDTFLNEDPDGLAHCRLAVARAIVAVKQTRFFGTCDYMYDWSANPLALIPQNMQGIENSILYVSGNTIAGSLWIDTSSKRVNTTIQLLRLLHELRERAKKYEGKTHSVKSDSTHNIYAP